MTSIEFVKSKLNDLFNKFNFIKIRYEYRLNTFTHLIEVLPLSFFEKNEEYMLLESEIENDFESFFPKENILFISENSLSEIKNPNIKLGYNKIEFENEISNLNFIIEGFNTNVEIQNINNYALAA